MSNYNEETGDLTFTKTGYQVVMSAFRKSFNEYIDNVFTVATNIHSQLAEIKGGQSSKKRKEKANQLLEQHTEYQPFRGYGQRPVMISSDLSYLVREELFRGKNGTLTKPRRSAFPKLINKVRNFTIDDSDLSIIFKDADDQMVGYSSGRISWRVDNNNRAVERANESPMGKLLLNDVLANYKWRRGEGGVFFYIDEYMREAGHDNGMGSSSSVSQTFGPAGKQHHEDEAKRFEAMFKSTRSKRRSSVKALR